MPSLSLRLSVPSRVFGWGQEGHEIVCAIAWAETTSVTSEQIKYILQIEARELFAELCDWVDDYRIGQTRQDPAMTEMAKPLSHADIHNLATF